MPTVDVSETRLRELADSNLSTRQIAVELGISKTYAHKLVKRLREGRVIVIKRGLRDGSDAAAYIREHAGRLSDNQIAEACGVTRAQVRNYREKNNLPAYRPPPSAKQPAKPFVLESRFVAANDQEAIDEFIARKGITVCPPGTACGLSAIERHLYAAKPPSKDYTAWQARRTARAGK